MPARPVHAGLTLPVVGAPLAGGGSTPALAAAVTEAGGLGFLAAGYLGADAVAVDIAGTRALTSRPFGVNVFVPGEPATDLSTVAEYAHDLEPEAAHLGVAVGEPRFDDDAWEAKLDLLLSDPVPVVSFTFGAPSPEVVGALRAAGSAVWITVTSVSEARRAGASGADALVVQGAEAGGHQGTFDDASAGDATGLLALLALVGHETRLPLVAAGGIATGAALAAVLAAGASAAQLGTALLRCPEAGTSAAHRAALGRPTPTAMTRAFTGRRARGLRNRFLDEHSADAPSAYPEVHHLTAPLRAAARDAGDPEALHLWAGQAQELGTDEPAGDLVRRLAAEARVALDQAARLVADAYPQR